TPMAAARGVSNLSYADWGRGSFAHGVELLSRTQKRFLRATRAAAPILWHREGLAPILWHREGPCRLARQQYGILCAHGLSAIASENRSPVRLSKIRFISSKKCELTK